MATERSELNRTQEPQTVDVNARLEHELPQPTNAELKAAPKCLTLADTLKELCKTLEFEVKEGINRINAGEDTAIILHSVLSVLQRHIPEIHYFLHPLSAQEQLELDSLPPLYNVYNKVVAIHPSVHKIKELHNLHGSLLLLAMKLAAHYLLRNNNTPAGQDLAVFGGLADVIDNFDDNRKRLRSDPRVYNKPDLWVEILMARCNLDVAMARSCLVTEERPETSCDNIEVDVKTNKEGTVVSLSQKQFTFTGHSGEKVVVKANKPSTTRPLFTAPPRSSVFPFRTTHAAEDQTDQPDIDYGSISLPPTKMTAPTPSHTLSPPPLPISTALQRLSATESTARNLHILFRSTTNMTNLSESWTNSFWAHLGMVRDCIYGIRSGDSGAAVELWKRVYGDEVRVDVRSLGNGARVRAGDGGVGYTYSDRW